MRTLSTDATAAVLSPESGLHLLWIIEINHPSFDAPVRLSNSSYDVSHNGNTYSAFGFIFDEPQDDEDGVRSGTISINNADRYLTPLIRGADWRLTATVKLVSCTAESVSPPEYDEVEIEYPAMSLEDITMDTQVLQASLKPEQYQNEPWPRDTFNTFDFRSL